MDKPTLQKAEYKYNVAMTILAFTAILTFGKILSSNQCTALFAGIGSAYGAVNYLERKNSVDPIA